MKSNIIDVTCIIKHRTEKAVLVDYDDGKEPCWLPLSAIEIESNRDGKTVTISLEQSLAEEKGMV